ncbi:hypothetical protein B0T25DRAFT_565889 [Lasiosphaeria hispida]|uniref:Uncharacterized protein n=1 Tax=Lasiosphaeria hispida TaxID=260671 RepID=A0AAJ0HL05_9PEZI|nr:hypothetical protein B0T25DRAFT_565889 [Lasiosphaeria hispida]
MRPLFLAALLRCYPVLAQINIGTTWLSTSFISETYSSSTAVDYGNTPVTPVPTLTADIVIVSSYVTEALASRDIYHTTWTPIIVTRNTTVTDVTWTSPIVATITLSPSTCINEELPSKKTVTNDLNHISINHYYDGDGSGRREIYAYTIPCDCDSDK